LDRPRRCSSGVEHRIRNAGVVGSIPINGTIFPYPSCIFLVAPVVLLIDNIIYVHYSRHMDIKKALIAFDALSQETRLRVFRMLVEHGMEGVPAGALSDKLKIPHNTLSFHLNHMSNAELVLSRREGRSIIYSANFEFFTGLIRYMIEDCCRVEFASIRENKKNGSSVVELINCCQPSARGKKS
jgi:ArsR family transcriptional regulator, arsenate/arsenite/antimonite-responsive transcriptional repressor